MIPVTTFSGKTVAVFGLGLSGIASARSLIAGGANVAAWDDNKQSRRVAGDDIPIVDLTTADWTEFATLVLAPGVPLTHPKPHWTVERAKQVGLDIIGDTELFFRAHKKSGSKAKVVAITGTNGKSTTTALVVHILKSNGRPAEIGGNFGAPLLGLPPFSDDLTYVIEFSSFQIDLTPALTPDVACLLNITPDHLDRHGTIENYAWVKEKIFSGLTNEATAIVGLDDPYCLAIANRLQPTFDIWQISGAMEVENGIRFESAQIAEIHDGRELARIDLKDIFSLRGPHNWENAAAAAAICRSLGLTIEEIESGLRSFPGLAHRMEEVGRKGRILFVNDSKATNSEAAGKALACFKDIYWIAGGRAKEGGIKELERFHPNIRKAYLIGESAQEFAKELDGHLGYELCGTLDAAVEAATRDADLSPAGEPVVLLSPACASHDQYPSFVVRGEAFKEAVRAQQGVAMKNVGGAV